MSDPVPLYSEHIIVPGKMDVFGRTDIGCKRESNQDQFLIADLLKSIVIHHSSLGYDNETQFSGASRAKLLMVADGMGGYAGGERASWLAIEGVVQYLLTSSALADHLPGQPRSSFLSRSAKCLGLFSNTNPHGR